MSLKERTEIIVLRGTKAMEMVEDVRDGLLIVVDNWDPSNQNMLFSNLKEAQRMAGYICRGLSCFRIVRGMRFSEKGWLKLILSDVWMLKRQLDIAKKWIQGWANMAPLVLACLRKVRAVEVILQESLTLYPAEQRSAISTFRFQHPRSCISGVLKRSDAMLLPQKMFASMFLFSGEKQELENLEW